MTKIIIGIEAILSLVIPTILIGIYYTTWWIYFIVLGHFALLIMEIWGIQSQNSDIRLIIASGFFRCIWTMILLFTGNFLLFEDHDEMIGLEILFFILFLCVVFTNTFYYIKFVYRRYSPYITSGSMANREPNVIIQVWEEVAWD